MRVDEARLIALAGALADGVPVDWDSVESAAESDEELEVIKNLRALSTLATVHRTMSDEGGAEETTLGPTSHAGFSEALAVPHWGHLALLERLGAGSQGDVFRAVDTRLDREVALKFLKRTNAFSDLQHMLTEARLLARVRHPNVVTVHGADLIDGRIGLWMELVSGETLDALVRRNGPMSAAEGALVGVDLCRALGAVHAAGLLHRDIKAQNVMRESGGRYVLMDFGTGHDALDEALTQTRAGTPLYQAPEVLANESASVRSDIYALGVLLFHLTTGSFPVVGGSVAEIADKHAKGDRRRLGEVRSDLPQPFVDVVERAIDPVPARRFASAADLAAALARVLTGSTEAAAQQARRMLPWWYAAAVAIVAAAIASAFWIGNRGSGAPPARTIAVLPFDDLSGTDKYQHIGRGLADLVTTDLGHRTDLRVVSTSSAAASQMRQRSDVFRALGVDAIVEGGLRPVGDKVRATARVVQASTGTVLWSDTYDASSEQLLDLERQITSGIAGALSAALKSSAQASLSPPAAALDAYFWGWAEFYPPDPDRAVIAQERFRRAVTLAPTFAPAQASLAYTVGLLETSFKKPQFGGVREAEVRAEEARRLDPTLGYAEAVSGWLRFTAHWDWKQAEAHFRRAIELNPSDAYAHGLYAQLLMASNRLDAALIEARLAAQLDPLNPARHGAIAICLSYARRFDEAIEEQQKILARDPNSELALHGLGRFLSFVGRYTESVTMFRSLPNLEKRAAPIRDDLARVLYLAGETAQADALLPQLETEYRNGALAPDYLAYVAAANGDRARAIALLQQAVAARSPSAIWIAVDPRFDVLRQDPSFVSLISQLRLAN